ncbi:MAG: HIT domain-containing protein [Nanoarchaeota archaeon]
MEDKQCIFCRILRGKIASEFIAESNSFFAILDRDQSVKGHVLVIPKEHYVTLLDIPDKLGQEMLKFTKQVAGHLMDEKKGDGFNVIMNNLECAGQAVMHAHIHIIPRNEGDGIRFLTRV